MGRGKEIGLEEGKCRRVKLQCTLHLPSRQGHLCIDEFKVMMMNNVYIDDTKCIKLLLNECPR